MDQQAPEVSSPEQEKTSKLRLVGRLLIGGSFLVPFLLLAPLWEVAQAAHAATQALFTLVVVGVVGLLATIRREPRVVAWGTFLITAGLFRL